MLDADYFLALEAQLWQAKVTRDVTAVHAAIAALKAQSFAAEDECWRSYYIAYALLICCQLGEDAKEHAKAATEILKQAHGSDQQSAEFYTLVASSYGHLAAATQDPIAKARAGLMSDSLYKHALEADANNPRTCLIQGLSYLHKPRLVGGSKKKAMALFEKAVSLFQRSKNTAAAWPAWGQQDAMYWLAHCYLHFNEFGKASALTEQLIASDADFGWASSLQKKIQQKMHG
ncbi:tetratricopeptide repeat protein [Rheinheimera riviphila]|uniref:Tetratricopeptide repeat protein n=1 Tax=Rheinheimera riviphila TaxID=1834037 RepID=A0A437R5A7_9GAMM|nr:tetratricopeptide repeat protein [Rheinheimera riviphila]RVU41969.1 tetratricopeptide repeat protein [Rheinheimera riviphila]